MSRNEQAKRETRIIVVFKDGSWVECDHPLDAAEYYKEDTEWLTTIHLTGAGEKGRT